MNEQASAKKIFEICSKQVDNTKPPVAYINVVIGLTCAINEEKLSEAFDKLKWDTSLSSSELAITRSGHNQNHLLTVTSMTEFEVDGKIGVIPISNGCIFPD